VLAAAVTPSATHRGLSLAGLSEQEQEFLLSTPMAPKAKRARAGAGAPVKKKGGFSRRSPSSCTSQRSLCSCTSRRSLCSCCTSRRCSIAPPPPPHLCCSLTFPSGTAPSPIAPHICASAAFMSLASTSISSLLPCMAVVLILLATMKRKRFVVTGRAANKRRRREGIVEELFQLDDATFLRMMRMPKNIFKSLAVRITPHLRCHWTPHSRRMAKVGNGSEVSPELILAATIRWLAGGSVWDVGFMFKLSAQGTFHDYKWRVIDALNDVLKDNVNFPLTDEGLSCLSQGFADRDDNIPNVVAAVDCAVLQMRAPPRAPFKDKDKRQTNVSSEYCRKGFFGTTVLAFVDAHMRFLSISITCGSSSHDSTMFEASKMGRLLTKPKGEGGIDNKWVVLGDDAFKAVPHVMTPFQKTWLTPQQKTFNYCLSKLRSTVECAFGLWKGKWGIFWRPLQVNKKNIRKLVEVTARLHNLCINRKVSDNLADFVVADDIFLATHMLRCGARQVQEAWPPSTAASTCQCRSRLRRCGDCCTNNGRRAYTRGYALVTQAGDGAD